MKLEIKKYLGTHPDDYTQTYGPQARELQTLETSAKMGGIGWPILWAVHSGKVIGLIAGGLSPKQPICDRIIVDKKYRRKGVGTALFRAFLTHCRKTNQCDKELVLCLNKASLDLIQKNAVVLRTYPEGNGIIVEYNPNKGPKPVNPQMDLA